GHADATDQPCERGQPTSVQSSTAWDMSLCKIKGVDCELTGNRDFSGLTLGLEIFFALIVGDLTLLDCHDEPTICRLLKLKESQHSGIANAAAVFPFVGKPKPAAPALFEQAPDCAQPATNGGGTSGNLRKSL